MVVKGSGGEKYTLNTKNKRTYRTYTDYSVGNGKYVARILDRKYRVHSTEGELEEAVRTGSYYEDEVPLNLLYIGKKFAGYLYEGDGELNDTDEVSCDDLPDTEDVYKKPKRQIQFEGNEKIFIISIHLLVAVGMAIVGLLVIHPMLLRYVYGNHGSSIINILYYLDYKGIPAIVVGIVLQVYSFIKLADRIENYVLSGLVSLLANLVGTVLWTVLVLLLMVVLAKYLVWIVLIVIAVLWLKKKFRL